MFVFIIPFIVIRILYSLYRKFILTAVPVKDKIVLVTGASSGLGEACAKKFAEEGAKVILCARNVVELKRVKKEISGDENSKWPVVYSMDVTQKKDIDNCIQEIESNHCFVDILISNAGVSLRGTVIDTDIEVHRKMMEVSYFGPVNLVKAVLPSMLSRRTGHIVSIGSLQAVVAIPYRCAYASSKHASQAFFDSLRAEVCGEGINISTINPGYIRTNLSKNAFTPDGEKHGVMDKTTASGMPPEYVAECVYDCVYKPRNDLLLCGFFNGLGPMTRHCCPPLYHWYMARKGRKEAEIYKKKT